MPPGKLDEVAVHPVHNRLVVGEVVERRALGAEIADAHVERVDAGEHVELRHYEPGQTVDARRVLERDEVEPAGAAGAGGGGGGNAGAAAAARAEPVHG